MIFFIFKHIDRHITTVSHPDLIPVHSCKLPFVLIIPLLKRLVTAFPIILPITSPMPIGLIPGFLSCGINLKGNKTSRLSGLALRFVHMILVKRAIDLLWSVAAVPKIIGFVL